MSATLADPIVGPKKNRKGEFIRVFHPFPNGEVCSTIPANPSLNPTSLAFGDQKKGTTSAPLSATLSNTGSAALTITSVAATGNFKVATNTCGTSLASGGHCAIGVTFHPTKLGTLTGTLTIKDFNPDSPHTVSLSGTGN